MSPATPMGGGGQLGDWVRLDSRSLHSVAFDQKSNALTVYFNDGDTWQYKNVPHNKYKTLVNHNSSGKYLRDEIILHHDGQKLHDGAPGHIA